MEKQGLEAWVCLDITILVADIFSIGQLISINMLEKYWEVFL